MGSYHSRAGLWRRAGLRLLLPVFFILVRALATTDVAAAHALRS